MTYKKPTARSWFGLSEQLDFSKARWLGPFLTVIVILLFALAVMAAFKILTASVFGGLPKGTGASFGLTGIIVAMIGAPFVIWRTMVAQKQSNVSEDALFNDKIDAAVANLYALRQVTKWNEKGYPSGWEDDVTRRNGAIDRLEGLAGEDPKAAPRIARMLSVYVQELSRESPAASPPDTDNLQELLEWVRLRTSPRSDIGKAVQVLGRLWARNDNSLGGREINLMNSNLQASDFSNLNFTNANLTRSLLRRADLSHAKLEGANLEGAKLQSANMHKTILEKANLRGVKSQGAFLSFAKLQQADFTNAILEGADLRSAELQGATLNGAEMQGADLINAKLQGADLSSAELEGANLTGAVFDKRTLLLSANFRGAGFKDVDFSNVYVSPDQLQQMFGDASVTLPSGHGPDHEDWPEHWSKEKLSSSEFITQWRAFQASNRKGRYGRN
jgi:uncharacterized protein YjbI with pentapeptide repeats